MTSISISTESLETVSELFHEPMMREFDSLSHRRKCPQFDDETWLRMGIGRVIDEAGSGRGFLQEQCGNFDKIPNVRNYFNSLESDRRANLTEELNLKLLKRARNEFSDRLEDIEELKAYAVFSIDGHWHRGATHDGCTESGKIATGHWYALDMRSHTLSNLAVNDYAKENDMHVLKRLKPLGLRHHVPRGQRVLNIYDRAGIDFDFWNRCRKERAVYFLSRVKEGMEFDVLEDLPYDREDSRNGGIVSDQRVHTKGNYSLRVIVYIEPEKGETLEFLTNVTDVPPGVLAEMYRRRWEIEKVFDDLKNKLLQKKSWSSGQTGKRSQGQLIALTYNLIRFLEERIQTDHGIKNELDEKRQSQRREILARAAADEGRVAPTLLMNARRATQRSVKFIRWIRGCLRNGAAAAVALPQLRQLYAVI